MLLPKNEEVREERNTILFSTGISVPSLMLSIPQYTAVKINCISWLGLPMPTCAHDLLNDLENLLCAIVHPDMGRDNHDCIHSGFVYAGSLTQKCSHILQPPNYLTS